MYLNVIGQWSESEKLERSLKTAIFRLNPTYGYQGYQPDISRISKPSVPRYHELSPLGKFSQVSSG